MKCPVINVSGINYIRYKCLCFYICLKVKYLFDFSKSFLLKIGFIFNKPGLSHK
jgi:hypothetical protein